MGDSISIGFSPGEGDSVRVARPRPNPRPPEARRPPARSRPDLRSALLGLIHVAAIAARRRGEGPEALVSELRRAAGSGLLDSRKHFGPRTAATFERAFQAILDFVGESAFDRLIVPNRGTK